MFKKTISLIAFVCLFSSLSFAQKHYLGVSSGLNISNYNNGNNLIKYTNLYSPTFSLNYQFLPFKLFTLGTDLTYLNRGACINFTPTDEKGLIDYKTINTKINNIYLGLNLKAGINYTFFNRLYTALNVGILPSLLLSSKSTEGSNYYNSLNKIDWAINTEASIGYKIKNESIIYLSCIPQKSLNYIGNNNVNKNIGCSFNLGYKIAL